MMAYVADCLRWKLSEWSMLLAGVALCGFLTRGGADRLDGCRLRADLDGTIKFGITEVAHENRSEGL